MDTKKKKKQIDGVTAAYIALGVTLVSVITLLGASAFLNVNSIVVSGMVQYTPEQVAEASGIERGDNLLYFNKRSTTEKIITELPYINSVEITRDLPDTLMLEVAESTALAYMPFAGDALIIDSTGRVLDIVAMPIGTRIDVNGVSLIEVRGVPVSEATAGSEPKIELGFETSFKTMQDFLTAMEREGIAGDVNYLDVANITNIRFGYMDMFRVIIGGQRDYRQKISGLPLTISRFQERYPNTRGVLDMTDPSGDYRFMPDQ